MKHLFLAALILFLASSGPADAAEVIIAIKAVAAFVGSLGVVGSALLQLAIGSAMSMIAKSKMRKAQGQNSGIQTEVTLTGGTNSESFILGYYGTAGTWVCPPLSRGDRLKVLTYVIDLAGMPGHSLEDVFVNGEKLKLDGKIKHGKTVASKPDSFKGLVTVTYFDGSQTKAPVMMQRNYGTDPDFPWTAEMVGRGRCYVIVEFTHDAKVFSGLPRMRFGLRGLPLLDPRVGEVVQSDNLALLAYSVLRGFEFPDGTRWGGEARLADLPLSVWAAAMNEADRLIATKDENEEPQFRGGFEIKIAETEPAEVLERFMDACTGDLAEEGGTWYVRMGAPQVPSAFLTDDDLIVDAPMSLTPFAGLADSMNSLTLKYPNPAIAWEVSEAERILRPELEAQHEGRRLSEDLSLAACPFPLQVQRVGKAYIEDAQRDVLHSFTLPPDFAHLPPLSVVSWTSEHNQYDGKHFSIEKKVIHPHDLLASVEVREVDPADHSWSTDDELPVPDGVNQLTPPVLFILNGVRVAPVDILDSDGNPRRAAIEVSQIPIVEGVEWRVFDFAGTRIADGVAMDVGDTFLITQGILPGHTYFVSLRVADEVNVDWSAWYEVNTNDVRLGPDDLSEEVWQYVDGVAVSALNDFNGSMTYALEKLAQVDLENRVSGFLEAARIEGEVNEKTEALSSEMDGVRADLVQNYITAAMQDSALAVLRTSLTAEIDGVSASLSTSYYTISQVNSAISAARTSLRSEITGVSATLNADYYTIAQTNSAISAATTSVTSTLDSLTTTVNQVQSSVDGVKGTYGVQVNNNGVVTGFGLVSELINGSVSTTFTVQADRFVVASSSGGGALSPFLISGGKVYIRDAVIRNASISSAKIKALAVDTLHIKGKAVDTRQIAENAATTFYEATGGTGYKRIQIRNTHDEPITLIIQVLYDCQDDGGSAALFAGVKIYKEQTAGGKNNLLSSVGDGSTGGGEVAAADGTEVVTTTINPGITRYISAYPEGRVVRRCDMIILQRQR
ncbi:phage tail protein [Phaeobacter inhibens]|uniref:phage tail protein n=1 Tax=Phaeobacter inhibens TaxID=221822 RepID=UPI0026E3978D|nr:phage tail protein [Phaeobacter inhibens]MDO6758536.1 phage tail protein [Phaeobacter inhibens]